jgi:hypothetical protein
MIDQDVFRKTYHEVNDRVCAFEKSILSRKCACAKSRKLLIAEREGIHCTDDTGQAQCLEFLELLRQHARFALKTNQDKGVLPHGKAMRLQVGGLRGLYIALYEETPDPAGIDNIFNLINLAKEEFNGLANLPFQILIQQVAAYQGRQRPGKKTD